MHLDTNAIICSARPHGENGAIVRFLTAESGLVAGYVPGGRSRKTRPILGIGNVVRVLLDSRNDTSLARAKVDLEHSRAGMSLDALALAIAEWLTGLAAQLLPEGHPYPRLFEVMGSVLDLAELQSDRLRSLSALAQFERLLLAELGFGLDLSSCAVTEQTHDLAFVSPKSGRAVSAEAGAPYASKLFRLPDFLASGETGSTGDVAEALRMTRYFIERDLLTTPRERDLLTARDRIDSRIGAD